MTITVVVVDDQHLIRAGFRLLLDAEPDIVVVGEADNGASAVQLTAELKPDVVLMDIRMPIMDGVQATARITTVTETTRVLVLTTFDQDDYVIDALRAGASGFLLKDVKADALAAAVRIVAQGDAVVSPTVTKRLLDHVAGRLVLTSTEASAALGSLTERERQVLTLAGQGMSNAEIARTLFVGQATVKTHLSRVMTKLHLRDRVHAVVVAYETGLVTPGQRSLHENS